ncbi:MAG: methionine ABC transporter ATP-binding protein [Parachlamydia sp.]|jgi:D-methionine transport system ATP-binding protein|nr:methionine ABC transporter ATP-binding protein [Parachlamydia sp.]
MKSIIQVNQLSKIYYNDEGIAQHALKNLQLTIPKRSIYGIIGTSGAGKSTLMRCLLGLEHPSSGSLLVEGETLTTPQEFGKKMGMVFQHFHLFSSRTVLQNIAYPLEIHGISSKDRIEHLLDLMGLSDKRDQYPARLSGGEKQRVALARALVHSPSLLLCDEPTSALDAATADGLMKLIEKLNREEGLSVVIITHQLECVKQICHKVAVLSKGEVVEEGDVEQIFTHPKHPLTRSLLNFDAQSIPQELLYQREGRKLIRLGFKGERAKEPVISQLLKRHDVEMNILSGGLDRIKETMVGSLLVELSGSQEALNQALGFLEHKQITCEVIA